MGGKGKLAGYNNLGWGKWYDPAWTPVDKPTDISDSRLSCSSIPTLLKTGS